MRGGTLNFCAFNMVPKMENKLGFIRERLFAPYDYLMSVGVFVAIKLGQE